MCSQSELILDGSICSICGVEMDGDAPGYIRECADCNPAEESKQRRAGHREYCPTVLEKEGIAFESKSKGAHLIVKHNGKVIDYWPGTGKFIDRATGNGKRGIRALLRHLKC